MSPDDLVARFLANDDAPQAFDALMDLRGAALPALASALERGPGGFALAAIVCALELDDPLRELGPMLDAEDDVHLAAVRALGASGDPRAAAILLDKLPLYTIAAAEALGDLGLPATAGPLLEGILAQVGVEALETPRSWLEKSWTCRKLKVLLAGAKALAKLGDTSLAAATLRLATLRSDAEHRSAADVRTSAVRALRYVTAPGVAGALRSAASDPHRDTAEAGLLGMLYLGRVEEAEGWIEIIEAGSERVQNAMWCLGRWAGEPLVDANRNYVSPTEVRRWWSTASQRFQRGVCYRFGQPADVGRLFDELPAEPKYLRPELHVKTGARCLHEGLMGTPISPGELRAIQAWRAAHAADLPPGKLHRWGRAYEPGVVD